jgi:hypothetical protein
VIDRGIEAKLITDIRTLLRPTGDPDCARAGQFGKLADERADWAARRRDDDRLAGLGLADHLHAGIGGEAWHAEHAQRRGNRR